MRVGIMLRAIDEKGGIGVYTRYLVEELLDLDGENEYVLFYRTAAHFGRHARRRNVTERLIQGANKFYWDQVAIPLACWKERVDVVLHPKFTAPLLAPCKAVMVLHGADWFLPEHARYYRPWDVRYIKAVMPWYCRKCTAILSVSELTTEHFTRILRLPAGKVQTVYFGPAKHFRPVDRPAERAAARARYRLPGRFILTLSGYDRGARKNIGAILEAYRLFHGSAPLALVVGGRDCHRFRAEYALPDDGWGADVHFPGWIDQEHLPAIYSMADLFLYPSNVEAFPIPLTEAMSCGTPIVTSRLNGLVEIAGDAARYVDADDPAGIAAAVRELVFDEGARRDLRARGFARARRFSWKACARRTLEVLKALAENGRRAA